MQGLHDLLLWIRDELNNLFHTMEMLWRDKTLVIRRFFCSKCSLAKWAVSEDQTTLSWDQGAGLAARQPNEKRTPVAVFSAVTCPPCRSTIALTMANPKPLPGNAVALRPRWKRLNS